MNFIIDNSKPTNSHFNRFVRPAVAYNSPCSEKPLCAKINSVSFVNKNNKIHTNRNVFVITETTKKSEYPGWHSFGKENIVQNIYSADPQKLRIGIF